MSEAGRARASLIGAVTSRAVLIVVLSVFAVLGSFIGITLAGGRASLVHDADGLEKLIADTLRIPLWSFEYGQVRAVGEALIRDEDIAELSITDDLGTLVFEYRSPLPASGIVLRREMQVSSEGRNVGRVRLVLSGRASARRRQDATLLASLALALALVGVSLGLRVAIRRSLSLPLGRLTDALQAYRGGDYGRPVGDLVFNEFADLAAVLGSMGATILEQVRQLRALNEGLEAKVEERTVELARKNRELDEERLRAEGYVESLTRANAAKDKFLAAMSHELRTPLNAILGFSDIIAADAGVPAGRRKEAELIRDAGAHLLDIINDLLDTSRIGACTLELENAPFRPLAIAEFAESLLRSRAEEKGLDFAIAVEGSLPQALFGDHRRVRQILLNLGSNAIKFTKAGRVEIRLSYEAAESILLVRVIDTGRGIPTELLPELWKPFARLRGEGEYVEGAGLGLSISQGFARLMGGSITVESAPGRGSVFIARLPLPVAGELLEGSLATPGIGREDRDRRTFIAQDAAPRPRLEPGPPAALSAAIEEAARRGDYRRLEGLVGELREAGLPALAERIERLAERYDESGILAAMKATAASAAEASAAEGAGR